MSRPLSADVRRRALDHARDLVLDDGLAALTFEGLARRSGVAKTTLYRHWETRHHLLHDVLADLVVPTPAPDTGSLRGDLAVLADGVPDAATEAVARRTFFLLLQAAEVDAAVRDVKEAMVAQRTAPIRHIVEAAVARRELAPDLDVDLAVDVILGPFIIRHLIRQRPLGAPVAERLLDAIEAALRAL